MKSSDLKEYIRKELDGSKEKKIGVVLIKPEDYREATIIISEYFLSRLKLKGIYVTLNMPYYSILENLKKNDINSSKLYFIDCVSKQASGFKNIKNCCFVENPESLTELSLAITEAINTGNFNFLVFDSISTMLMYNDLKIVERFVHYAINKLRSYDMDGALLFINDEKSKELANVIMQFCDKFIAL